MNVETFYNLESKTTVPKQVGAIKYVEQDKILFCMIPEMFVSHGMILHHTTTRYDNYNKKICLGSFT